MSVFRPKYRDKDTGELVESAVWWYEFEFDGQRIRKSTKQRNKRVAEQMEAAEKTNLAKGLVGIEPKPEVPTLREFGPDFAKAIETQCGDRPATVDFYKSKLAYLLNFEPLASAKLDDIDEAVIDTFTEHRTRQLSRRGRLLSVASVNRELATLRRLLRLAQKRKLIAAAPQIKLLSGEQEREFVLTPELEKTYLGAAPPDLHDMAVLMLDTGLRMKEALGLTWPNVHLTPAGEASLGYIRIMGPTSKGKKTRTIPLTARAAETLRNRKPQKSGFVFNREDGLPLYQTWVNQQHAAVRKLLKMSAEFVPHSFRHTYGTRLGEAGADAFTIMRLMGHSSVTVSQRYVHPTPETLERAVSRLEKLNRGELREEKVPQVAPKVKTTGKRKIQ